MPYNQNTITLKKYQFPILILFFTSSLFGQDIEKSYSLEINPGIARRIDAQVSGQFKSTHNIFVKKHFKSSTPLKFILGVGFSLINGGGIYDKISECDTLTISFKEKLSYFLITPGIKYSRNNFFILGEIGIGLNVTGSYNQDLVKVKYDPDPTKPGRIHILGLIGPSTSNNYPLMVSFGWDLSNGKIPMFVGIKTYTSLGIFDNAPKYYGIGLLAGIKF